MEIKCIAVDDEPLALEKIEDFANRLDFVKLERSFTDPVEAINYIKKELPDLIFLDIQMDNLTGIELLESIKPKCKVILTTAHSEYALKGYDLQVHDYLLKPYSFERFLQAVHSAHEDLRMIRRDGQDQKPRHLFIKSGLVQKKINIDDILYIEGMKDYLSIWTTQERIMTLMTFAEIEELLARNNFLRVHRSFIVSVDRLTEISRNQVTIGKQKIPIGEKYRETISQLLNKSSI